MATVQKPAKRVLTVIKQHKKKTEKGTPIPREEVKKTKDEIELIIEEAGSAIAIEICGDDLIQNRFNQKAIEEILIGHMGLVRDKQREPKIPRKILKAARVENVNGDVCIDPVWIKKALIGACSRVKNLKPKDVRNSLFIEGKSIPFSYEQEVPRFDMVHVGVWPNITVDTRFRPMFINWKARFIINYQKPFTLNSVIQLLDIAGRGGIAEWRPSKSGGTHGTFVVSDRTADISKEETKEIKRLCAPPLVTLQIPDFAMDSPFDDGALEDIKNLASEDKEAEVNQ